MIKPRVLYVKGLTVYQTEPCNIGKFLTMIEKSAYTDVKSKADDLSKALEDMIAVGGGLNDDYKTAEANACEALLQYKKL